MAFSQRTFTSFDSWVASVPPAPKCRECSKPMGLGDFTNSGENIRGERFADLEGGHLCRDCAVHLVRRDWQGRLFLLCTFEFASGYRHDLQPVDYDNGFYGRKTANCHDCRREAERQAYFRNIERLESLVVEHRPAIRSVR